MYAAFLVNTRSTDVYTLLCLRSRSFRKISCQGVEGVKGASSSVAMETDELTERMTCYMLFRKFIREVLLRACVVSKSKMLADSVFIPYS